MYTSGTSVTVGNIFAPSRLIVTLTGRFTRRVSSSLRKESPTGVNVVLLLKCAFAAEELQGWKLEITRCWMQDRQD